MAAEPDLLDALVIGAGPAGLTAGLYLRRFHRQVTIVHTNESRASLIPVSHNYPGFPQGVPGVELLARLREQVKDVDGSIVEARVETLRVDDPGFVALTSQGTALRARAVVLATGVVDREPAVPGIAELRRRGLMRQCPICDGFEFTQRRIGVIGAGVHGARETLFLRNYSDQVALIALDGATPLPDLLDEELRSHDVRRIGGTIRAAIPQDRDVRLEMADGSAHEFDVLYAALGNDPRSALARLVGANVDDQGALVVDAHCRTSVPGLYAAGDVVHGLDQLAVAVGHAAIAATAIHNHLRAGQPT